MRFLRQYFSYIVFVALVLASIGIWSAVFAATPSGVLTFAVLDIGQGDSLYIESPVGTQILIDGGPDGSVLHELPKVMSFSDRSIDAVIATHPDADHIAGLVDVLKRYSVGDFLEPGIAKSTVTAQALEDGVDAADIPRIKAMRGMWLDLGGGARLDILSPDFDVSTLKPDEANEGCVVSRLTYGATSVLLMCDAPMDVEGHLMGIEPVADLKSNILKVGHHGSAGSTGDAFVSEVDPSVAVISVGAGNRYGHPTRQTLDTLAGHNIKTLRTDEEGTIEFISNGETFERIR
ncbi:MAG TPA: MBL fold metallo-hydrolase [Candidatus Paceibacterota bacterium]|nr:MBL fold metallo-hydrolase [Candidatus Paceibacterota bacterium]